MSDRMMDDGGFRAQAETLAAKVSDLERELHFHRSARMTSISTTVGSLLAVIFMAVAISCASSNFRDAAQVTSKQVDAQRQRAEVLERERDACRAGTAGLMDRRINLEFGPEYVVVNGDGTMDAAVWQWVSTATFGDGSKLKTYRHRQ